MGRLMWRLVWITRNGNAHIVWIMTVAHSVIRRGNLKDWSGLAFDYWISLRNQTSAVSVWCWVGSFNKQTLCSTGCESKLWKAGGVLLERSAYLQNSRMGNLNRKRVRNSGFISLTKWAVISLFDPPLRHWSIQESSFAWLFILCLRA